MRLTSTLFAASLFLAMPETGKAEDLKLEYHGAGWVQVGRVENSFSLPDNNNDYEKNWLGNSGAVLSVKTQIDEHWEGNLGLGTIMVHLARGSKGSASKWYTFSVPFVSDARLTYTSGGYADNAGYQLHFGSMAYNYNPDAKNLGVYLMRGYVYPGTLTSGFGNIFGFLGKAKLGAFSNDFIVNLETEEKPLYDISVADVITWSPHKSVEVGIGANFYRLVPMNDKLTNPDRDCNPDRLGTYAKQGQLNACYILDLIDTTAAGEPIYDTTFGGFSGTKLVGRIRLDPKAFFSGEDGIWGKDDLVLYSEVGVIGVANYGKMYNDIKRRMPVMVGFNLPGFKFLNASVEVEYYANKLSGDNKAARNGSWVSAVDDVRVNTARDDWKYSVNVSKVLFGNMALSAQVANDHLRLGGNHDDDTGVEAMRTPEDWYWTTKLAYFF
jgi:hypothetical protein